MRKLLSTLGIFSVVVLTGQVTFENVSTATGLTYQGRSWGSSWGDINGDGFVDLFMSCHQHQFEPYFDNDSIQIFINLGGGHFDGTIYTLDDGEQSDIHGGVFFDQDNDGDQDMFIVTGGVRYEIFLRNDGGTHLEDIADEMNLIFENARGRQTTCVDVNNDGYTDLLINNQRVENPPGQGSVLMLADHASGFIMDTTSGFNDPQSRISLISDLNGDGRTDICVVNGTYLKIYSLTQDGHFIEQAQLDISNIGDISIADFNGDLLPDIFVARGIQHETDIQLFNDSAIHASCNVRGNTPPCTASFKTEGPITVKMSLEDYRAFNIHIGNDSVITGVENRQTFTLYPSAALGFQDPISFPGGVNCSFGYLPDSSWKVEVAKTSPGGNSVLMEITSNSPITDFTSVGMPPLDSTVRDILLLNQGDFQFAKSTSPAFLLDEYSTNVTCGDFDNDMDVDVFVVSTGRAKNRKTHLYENTGSGDFVVHENGWGTKGDVAGIGDAVTTTDYNNDGFLDLFVTNGSTNVFLDSAGVDLYRNMGNGNSWIKLDLTGVQSNPDGFGARVIVEANGVQQVRDMTGGIHLVSQDDARLHFGLGAVQTVDVITVYWPSGVVDVLHDQDVNEILTLVEGTHPQVECLDGEEALLLTFNLDAFGSQTNWKLLNANNQVVKTGGPYGDGDTAVTETICVPAGCYKLVVLDSNGDGLSGGGYFLSNDVGQRIIDANGAFGALSFAKMPFCVPIGEPHLITEDCDQVLTDGDAIKSSTVAGATQYRFLFFDPHGTYKRSVLWASGTLGPYALAYLPKNIELNVRINAFGPGWSTGYGPTCTLTIAGGENRSLQEISDVSASDDQRIEIWPNPIEDGQLNLSIVGLGDEVNTVEITVLDALGQRVMAQVLPVADGNTNAILDLGNIADGMYLLRAASGDEAFSRRMVVHK